MKKINIVGKLKNMTKKQKMIAVIMTIVIFAGITTSAVLLSANSNEKSKELADEKNKVEEVVDIGKDGSQDIPENTDILVESMSNTPYGIDTKPKIKVTSKTPMREDAIKKNLSFSPHRSYDIEKVNDKEYILSVNSPFDNNELVKVTYNTKEEKLGWAFQTVKKFGVSTTHPANEGYSVPTNTGIEIQFTKDIGEHNFDQYFNIKPSVEGEFKYEKDKIIFVPKNKLKERKEYEVTIKKGYSDGTETIDKDYSFTFKTDGHNFNDKYLNLYGTTESITYMKPNEPQMLTCYANGNDEEKKISLSIYKYKDKKDFVKGYYDRNDIDIDKYASSLTATENYTYEVTANDFGYEDVIELQHLDEGYYFLKAKYYDSVDYMFIQVSPYNAYTAVDNDKVMVWMVNGTTSELVKDANIVIDDKNIGKTDENGFAFLDKKQEYSENVLMELQAGNDNPLMIPLVIDDHSKNPNCVYWSYIYFDRGIYLPTDEINVFGFVQNREGKSIKNVRVELLNDNNTLMEAKEVKLSNIGTYETKFNIDNYLDSYLKVRVIVDGEYEIENEYIDIARFEKPTYKLDTSLDKEFIMMDDTVNYSADVTFYEGTPAADSHISIETSGFSLLGKETSCSKEYICDEKGHKEVELTPYLDTTKWKPRFINIRTRFDDLDRNYIRDVSSIILFPRDIMIETEDKKISNEEVEISVNLNNIDTSNFNGQLYDYDSYRGDGISSKDVEIEIEETYYERIYQGKEYDYINKRSYDSYTYERHDNILGTIEGITDENGVLTFNYDEIKENRGYRFYIRTKDSKGRLIEQIHYYSEAYYVNDNQNYLQRYSLHMNKDSFKKNDNMELAIKQGNENISERENDKSLFFICKEGIIDYIISDDTKVDIKYLQKYIPNATIYAVYFDGKSLHNDYSMKRWFGYDYEDEKLNVNIETDKNDYKPGDKVKLTVKVTDKDDRPVTADVNISVVDEAFFAICEDSTWVLSDLYRSVFSSGLTSQFLAAYNIYNNFGGAECGGEGDSEIIRSKFKNTADFGIIKTDENGICTKEFELPDNLTSWRITCTAINDKLKAGKEKYNINAKLPFFISSLVYDSYMKGDYINATIKTGGAKLKKEDSVEFTAKIEQEDGKVVEVTETGKGHEYVNIPIGKLPEGKHKITIIAKTGNYKDGEQYDIKIKDSLHYFDVIKQEDLKEDMEIISNDQYVNLIFLNKDLCEYYLGLLDVYYSNYNDRSEYIISSNIAGKELNKKFETDFKLDEPRCEEFVSYNGLYRDFSYGNNSAEITANLISVGFVEDREKQINGLLQAARDEYRPVKENIAALWGLSLLDEPVLLETNAMYTKINGTSETLSFEKMYMMLTFIENGELQKAKEIYNDIKDNHVKQKHEMLYIDDADTGNKFTAMMMMAAIKLNNLKDAKGMYAHLQHTGEYKYPTITERLYYLQNMKPKEDKASFKYELDGKEETVSLGINRYHSLDLTPEQAGSIKFSEIVGNVRVIKDFIGTVKDIEKTDKYNIERWYSSDGSGEDIKQGEIVTVHIKVNVLDNRLSAFVLEDILPTGLTFIGKEKTNSDKLGVWADNEARRTKLHVYVGWNYRMSDEYSFEITYKTKAVLAGEYIAEPIIIRDYMNDEITCSKENVVKIK
ncbi:Ig-like domain-containing alpha-2-macroglobulin family protein [Vallitalea guaymasensis]|uniref:Ig-like domain-containing alpha-2-macroglobulin family protein n=1 Tax=Vallitalea guaymasensis TaxID=1185412 RepID=UPI000DE48CCA|nr:Ig-like domain-containing alpha-2-macroglobulin family protein [Vallitalea guaymasensis]